MYAIQVIYTCLFSIIIHIFNATIRESNVAESRSGNERRESEGQKRQEWMKKQSSVLNNDELAPRARSNVPVAVMCVTSGWAEGAWNTWKSRLCKTQENGPPEDRAASPRLASRVGTLDGTRNWKHFRGPSGTHNELLAFAFSGGGNAF